MRRRRIVELTGAPGAGKSEVAERLAEILDAEGLRVPRRTEVRDLYLRRGLVGRLAGPQVRKREVAGQRLEYFKEVETPILLWRFRMRHRRGWRLYRAEVERLRALDPRAAEVAERWVEASALTYGLLRSQARSMDLFVWDEGIAHRSLNLFAHPDREVDTGRLSAFLRHWAFPDALVHVEADPAACAARIQARGLPERLEGRSAAEVRAFVEHGAQVARAVLEEARRRGLPAFVLENRYASADALRAAPACSELAEGIARGLRAGRRSAA